MGNIKKARKASQEAVFCCDRLIAQIEARKASELADRALTIAKLFDDPVYMLDFLIEAIEARAAARKVGA